MGESSRNYQNGKIYCIRNWVDDDIYVGSTCQPLSKRMAWHRQATRKEAKKHFKLYSKMNDKGIDNFYIELYEKYPCDSKEELFRKEGEIIRQLKPKLNDKIQGRTLQEWLKDTEDYRREDRKQRYDKNRDVILEKKKVYYEERRDEIYEKNKQRFEQNKDKYYENMKKKRQDTKDNKFHCECGSIVCQMDKHHHFKTKKHQAFIEQQKNII